MSTDFWRHHNFRLEPWGSDYQPPIEIDELSQSTSEVDATVETSDWSLFDRRRPLVNLPRRIIFIDGRRRIDAPLVGGSGNVVNYGAFGTVAAGAVIVDRSECKAICVYAPIRRILGFGGNQEAPQTTISCPLGSKEELLYHAVAPHESNNSDVRRNIVMKEMFQAEVNIARQFSSDDNTLVVRDGPLSYRSLPSTLGYIKTMHRNYLCTTHADLLWELEPGQRTPIFQIQDQQQYLWSWYLKSGSNETSHSFGYHDLHGIVRLELSSEIPLEVAIKIADQTTYLIPEYSSHPYKDLRAPQNLTPVGALERELGRRMGNASLIRRRVQHFLANAGGKM